MCKVYNIKKFLKALNNKPQKVQMEIYWKKNKKTRDEKILHKRIFDNKTHIDLVFN